MSDEIYCCTKNHKMIERCPTCLEIDRILSEKGYYLLSELRENIPVLLSCMVLVYGDPDITEEFKLSIEKAARFLGEFGA